MKEETLSDKAIFVLCNWELAELKKDDLIYKHKSIQEFITKLKEKLINEDKVTNGDFNFCEVIDKLAGYKFK